MRRNVLRIGVAYLVAAWVLVQIVNNVAVPLSLPHWTPTLVIVLLGVGFPIALIIAWAFELTPQGVKRTEPLATAPSFATQASAAPAAPAMPSIAVLPFADMSPGKDQEYFADGLSEELLNKLARLKGLQVAGRTSSFHFKGKNEDIRSIGEALGVANVLEGSVRKSDDKLRITAQLIDARNGYHLWTRTYDRMFDDIFAIQDEIAEGVAEALAVTLAVGDLGLAEGMTRNVEAYEAYLVSRATFTGRMSRERLRSQMTSLERAVRLDPSFAVAWARLAMQYSWHTRFERTDSTADWQRKADQALSRAVELAPNAAEVLAQRAGVAIATGNLVEAERMFREAIERHGESSVAFAYSYFLLLAGKVSQAIDYIVEAHRLDPLDVGLSTLVGVGYDEAGRTRDAMAEADRADAIGEPEAQIRGLALMVALAMRDRAEILRRLERLLEFDEFTGPLHTVVRPLLDDAPAALAELRRQYANPANDSPQHQLVIASSGSPK